MPFIIVLLPVLGLLSWSVELLIWSIILAVILISLSVRIVQPNTIKAVENFGKFNRILRPGLNFIIPIVEVTRPQILYRKNFPVEVEWITKDNVTWYIWLNVIYYIIDEWDDTKEWNIYKSIYEIDDPRTMMRATIDEQLRAMIINFTHKEIFAKREEIGEAIEMRLREKLSTFGFTLDSIQVRDVKLEDSVMSAMNKIVETEKLKEAAFNEAEAEKIKTVKDAEAEKDSKILLWEWMAGQRMKIAEWFKESVDMIKQADSSLNAQKVLAFLLDSSRIETLWNIGAKSNSKLIYLNEDLEWRASKLISWSELMIDNDVNLKK